MEEEEIPATGHTIVIDTSVEATCTKTGLTDGKHCSVCNTIISKQSETPKKEHDFVDDICTVCGEAKPEKPAYILGDVNCDGNVTILDLMRLANHFANAAEINVLNADVNGDGNVTILDLMRLANYFAGNATLG